MKILLATMARGRVGGVETFLRGVSPHLVERGHRLALVYEHRWEQPADRGGEPYAGFEAEWNREENGSAAILAGIRQWAPDLVWLHPLEDSAWELALGALAPCVWHVHGFQGTCATGTRMQWRPVPHSCERELGPACLAQNYLRGCGMRNPIRLVRQWRGEEARRRALQRHAAIIACSEYLKAELQRHGAPVERVHALPYPLFHPVAAKPAARTTIPDRLLCLARLTRLKGVQELLRAVLLAEAALQRRLHLVVGGVGPELKPLQALAETLGLAVEWRGWLDREATQLALQQTDLLAVPSLWPEPFGIVGQEGQAAAVPAVAYQHGGIPEWLQAGENGELAPARPPTPAGLAQAMVRALGDREHLEHLRLGAWRSAARYALPAFLDRLEAVWAGALARPAA